MNDSDSLRGSTNHDALITGVDSPIIAGGEPYKAIINNQSRLQSTSSANSGFYLRGS